LKELQKLFRRWAHSAEAFVYEALRVERISTQQKHALEMLSLLVNAKMKRSRGEPLNPAEEAVVRKDGISIMSGKGVGKDCFAAWAILWFVTCMPKPKVPCTAPTSHQLSDVLWSECAKWLRHSSTKHREEKSGFYLDEWLTYTAEKLYFTEFKGAQWFAVARTTNVKASAEQQAETLQGFHEDFLMIVADEASGLPDAVFKPLETTMTGPVNFALLIFNPTRPTGFAIDSQVKFREHWICLRWNAEESENVAKDQIEKLAKKYGKDSNMYRISVLGLPPKADPDMLIPWDWAMAAVDAEIEPAEDDPLILTIDPGGSGENADLTAMALIRGNKVLRILEYRGIDTEQIANWAMHHIFDEEPRMVIVDIVGIGQGVYDKLNHRVADVNIVGLNVGELAANDDRYPRLRDELWWQTRELFERRAISIPDDPELIGELTNLKTAPNDDGRMKVEGKRELKARGVSSPNKADCVMMGSYFAAASRRKMVGPRRNRRAAAGSWRTA
jgi:hypothetical protein